MLDDGEFAGVPIGGLGTGSIGRTYRGDVARWHLEVGQHRHRARRGGRVLAVRRRPGRNAGNRPVGAATGGAARLGLGPAGRRRDVSRAVPAGVADLRARDARRPGRRRAAVARSSRGDLERSALPVGVFEWWLENPGPDPLTVGLLFTWADPLAATGRPPARPHTVVREDGDRRRRRSATPRTARRPALRGSLAIAALDGDGVELSARAAFDPVADRDLWADFAADGRLDPTPAIARPIRPATGGGAALAATSALAPGERRSVRFALAWDLPVVEFGAGRRWWKRYTRTWGRSGDARARPRPACADRGARVAGRDRGLAGARTSTIPAAPTGT